MNGWLYILGNFLVALAVVIFGFVYLQLLKQRWYQLLKKENLLKFQEKRLCDKEADGKEQQQEFMDTLKNRHVQYENLTSENASLKKDLFNLSVKIKKMERDQASLDQRQKTVDEKVVHLAQHHLSDNVALVAAKLNLHNYSSCKMRLQEVIRLCRVYGYIMPKKQEEALFEDLKTSHEKIVQRKKQRQEQAQIKAQEREEEKVACEAMQLIPLEDDEQMTVHKILEGALVKIQSECSFESEFLETEPNETLDTQELEDVF